MGLVGMHASTTVEAERVLLHATTRLALETSHKVRTLQAIAALTLTSPDTCSVGNICQRSCDERTYLLADGAYFPLGAPHLDFAQAPTRESSSIRRSASGSSCTGEHSDGAHSRAYP